MVDAFLNVLGEGGTLVVPTFGSLGIITDTVKNRPNAVKSIHPLACVAAIGKYAEEICRDHWKAELAHAEDTPYLRIAQLGGYVCLLGVDQDRNTTLHTVEELLRLPYLRKTAESTFDTPEGKVTKSWPFFPGPHRDFIGLDRALRESGRMRMRRIGDAVSRLIKSADLIEIAKAMGESNPAFVLCENPNCADCVQQRAAIRQARFAKEPFRLAVAASLAGTYAEEIADHCQAAGVTAVELDHVKRWPLTQCQPRELDETIERIGKDGCAVTSLRLPCATVKLREFLDYAARKRIMRVGLPLSASSVDDAQIAQSMGIAVSFFNLGIDSQRASEILLAMRNQGLTVNFTFNAANFAGAGEKPFLHSYKQKLNRFIDQLDVEDARFDGSAVPLGQGHAEIKELISILRAAGFSGWMVLAAGNRHSGTLLDAVRRWEGLLAAM